MRRSPSRFVGRWALRRGGIGSRGSPLSRVEELARRKASIKLRHRYRVFEDEARGAPGSLTRGRPPPSPLRPTFPAEGRGSRGPRRRFGRGEGEEPGQR